MGNAAPHRQAAEESFESHELQSGVFAVGERRDADASTIKDEEALALSLADALCDILSDETG